MKATEILQAARSAGLIMSVAGAKLSVRGDGDRQSHLIESIRANKREIMALIESEAAKEANEARKGFSDDWIIQLPDLCRPEVMPSVQPHDRQKLVDQVMRQGKPAIGWCVRRANAYFEKIPHSTFEDQDAAAALDFLRWQDGFARKSSHR